MFRQDKIISLLIFVIALSLLCAPEAFSQHRKIPPFVSVYGSLHSVYDGNRLVVNLISASSKSEKWIFSDSGKKSFPTSLKEKGVYTCAVAVFDAKDSLINHLERKFYASCEERRVIISVSYSQNGYRMHNCNDASFQDCQYIQSDEGTLFITKFYAEDLDGKYSEQDAKVRESESPTFPNDWKTEIRSRYDNGSKPTEKKIESTPDYFHLL